MPQCGLGRLGPPSAQTGLEERPVMISSGTTALRLLQHD
eukprot:CAMPEP_0179101518 /NCGR_PEP_ID=MMETSP0796-20121207/46940_1 /TAXON_ID=73915 /ORGANISM="Pyrodinium bahamense, Strain pbaha01" /LENGTH=38 /DNA_ID= /DNA_START= /DNA_END= /DNA_ORIENTATION=